MKNYIICFYFLQHCLYHTLEEQLAELLAEMQFEDKKPSEKMVSEWGSVIDSDNMSDSEIAEKIADHLSLSRPELSRTVRYIRKTDNAAYFAYEARQMADEYLEGDSI